MTFAEIREVPVTLDSGAKVRTVIFNTETFGLEFINTDKIRTRAVLSREAVIATVNGFNTLIDGGGRDVAREWKHIPSHELKQDGEGGLPIQPVSIPLWLAQELMRFIEANVQLPKKETLTPIGSINAFKAAISLTERKY